MHFPEHGLVFFEEDMDVFVVYVWRCVVIRMVKPVLICFYDVADFQVPVKKDNGHGES